MAQLGPSTRQSTPTIQPEPSDQWKADLRARIQRNLAPMVKDAEENLAKELNKGPIDDSRRQALHDAHAKAMNGIRRMAQDTYNAELERERQERRWMGGQNVEGEWGDVLAKQQQAIMDEIKEKTARSRSNTLEEERKDAPGPSAPSARGLPPQAPQPPITVPPSARNVAPVPNPTISPADGWKATSGAGVRRRPSNMSESQPRPFRDGSSRPDIEDVTIRQPLNPSVSPSDVLGNPVHRRPSHVSEHRPAPPRDGRLRGNPGSVGNEPVARWLPTEPPPPGDAPQGGPWGRQRQGSAGSNRSLGDGSLDRWMPHANPEDTVSLSRRPSSLEKSAVNGRGAAAQGWRPTLTADDRTASSRTLDIARADAYESGDGGNNGTGDEADSLSREWSRVSRGKPRRHDRTKQRTGPSSPSLLDPPRPAPSQQVSLVEVRRTSSSPIFDAVELPLARPVPNRRPSTRMRSRSPLGVYDGSRSPPNGPPPGFQPLVAPEDRERRSVQPHPLLTLPRLVNPSSSVHTGMSTPQPTGPIQSNITASRPLVRRRSFSGGESPMHSPSEERDWYPAHRELVFSGDDVRPEPLPRSPWGAQPSPAGRAPLSGSPHSPGWHGSEPPPSDALSQKFRRGSASSLLAADERRGTASPGAGASASRPINLAKKRSSNLREDIEGLGVSASSPRARGWVGPAPIPEDGHLEEFPVSSPTYRDEMPPPPPLRGARGSRPGSLRSRGSHDMRPPAQEIFTIGRRRSNNYDEALSDEASEDEHGLDRRSVRSFELDEALRREREAKRREEDARRKEEDARRKEEEAMKKEDEARKEKEEARRREEDARKREEESRRMEEEVRKEREELRRREEEVKRKEEEARLQLEEARRKETEAKWKEEEARRKEAEALAQAEETRLKEEEMKRKEEQLKRMREDATRKEEEAKRHQDELKRLREEARKQQAEHRRQMEEAKREAKRKLEDALREASRKEEDARRQLDDAKREAKRRDEDFQRREESFQRREQELERWQEELSRREAIQKREKQLMEREELLRQREEMQRQKDALERERLEDEEARRLEEELRMQELEEEEEERQRQEELLRIHEEQQQHEEELRRQQEDEEEARQLELLHLAEEAEERRQEELRQDELRLAHDEEDRRRELRRQEEEARRQELLRKKQAEEQLRQDEELARRIAQEEGFTAAQRKAQLEEHRRQELAMHKQQAERQRRDQGAWRPMEDEPKRREDPRHAQAEQARKAQEEDRLRREKQAQDDLFRLEEEFRRRSSDRTRADSTGSVASASASASVPRPIPPRAAQQSNSIPIPGDRTSTGSSNWSGTGSSASAWSASTRATSATSASTARPMNFPSVGTTPPSVPPPRPPTSANMHNTAPSFGASPSSAGRSAPQLSESEWARRQAEQAKKQQEAFRREQERQEREKQTKAARAFTREDAIQVFQRHEQAWMLVRSAPKLRWDTFPWPVFKKPSNPEELTTDAVGAYVLSPHHPTEAAKSNKDRVKDHIKRWHPDRFETQLLPKVNDEEKERVKEGAGWVARALNDLLTRINSPGFFD